jgi:uncharacterized membrane protein HdeD (DUF308 family)
MAVPMAPASRQANRVAWIYMLSGILCVLFGAFMLSIELEDLVNAKDPRLATYLLVALTGGYLVGWGLFQLAGSLVAPRGTSRLYAFGGALAVIAGFLALVWPDITLFILVLFVGWSLIVWGILDLMAGVATRGTTYWSLYVARGVVSILIGFFALHREALTVDVLVFVVAIQAILWGMGDLMAAHMIHGARSDWMAMGRKPAAARPATTTRKPARKPAKRKATRR